MSKIPKKIHYVWVGKSPKSKDILRCMKTWSKHLEGYEIIEWNEDNFDINAHPFCKKAYEAKKWAFVSDYIRAYVIYHEGGIYLDTDIILLDNFDKFLDHDAFVGFENTENPFTAVFGAKRKHPFVKKILDYYDELDNYSFNFADNNTLSVSNLLVKEYKCKKNNKFQILKDDIVVYPDYVLCNPSKNSISIHIFTGTWLTDKRSVKYKFTKWLKLRLTTKNRAELYRRIVRRK